MLFKRSFCHEKSIRVLFSTSNYKYRETLELDRLEIKSCLCFLKMDLLYIYPPHGSDFGLSDGNIYLMRFM